MLQVHGQNYDLPSPVSNNQTLPTGSYVIAMDNTNQLNNSSDFNLKSYGLVVHLLNNGKKIKWIIKAGKGKDSIDFSVNATKIKPVTGTAANFNFKAGPFVIFAADTTGVAALINGFNAGISNTNDKVKVYKTNASVTVDVRYDMTGFVPKAAILDDGASVAIHVANMTECNVTTANYKITIGTALLTDCYTFASEAHNSNTGQEVDNAISSIHRFVEYGGNFLAQCHALSNYENNVLGRFQTINGVTIENAGAGTNISYGNPDLSYSQFDGAFSISKGGSVRNWSNIGSSINNFHKHARGNADTTIIGASVSKHRSGTGGLVFFLGNHRFDDQIGTLTSINGLRMYMNAFLTPVGIATNCSIGEIYIYPLSMKILSFKASLFNNLSKLSWDIYQNETVDKIEVQSSTDGVHYVTDVIIKGNLISGNQSYFYNEQIRDEIVYYRLKLVEQNNVQKYSRVIMLKNNLHRNDKLILLNNPLIEDKLNFIFNSSINEQVTLKVNDQLGRSRLIQKLACVAGKNNLGVLLPSALPNGVYIAEVIYSSGRTVEKFIK